MLRRVLPCLGTVLVTGAALLALTGPVAPARAATAASAPTDETVTGRIVHADGSDYAGVSVSLFRLSHQTLVVEDAGVTDASGRYALHVPSGYRYTFRTDPDDTGSPTDGPQVDLTGPGGGTTTEPAISTPDYTYVDLGGTVTDAAGAGLAGAGVAVFRDDAADCYGCHTEYAYREAATRTVTADGQGRYTISHVRVGAELDLMASKLDFQPTTAFGAAWVREDEACCTLVVDTAHTSLDPIALPGDGVHLPRLRFPEPLRLTSAKVGAAPHTSFDYYSPVPLATTARFRWLRDGRLISGPQARSLSRLPTRADAGHRLQLEETATLPPYYTAGLRRSNAVRIAWPGISLGHDPIRVGVRETFYEKDGTGTRHGRYSHVQWLLDGRPIAGATGQFYRPRSADRGHLLSVRNTSDDPTLAPPRVTGQRRIHRSLAVTAGDRRSSSVIVTGKVIEKGTTTPYDDVRVYLAQDASTGVRTYASTRTRSDGTWSAQVPPGTYEVYYNQDAQGASVLGPSIDATAGASAPLESLPVPDYTTATGQVVDASGTALENATVDLSYVDPCGARVLPNDAIAATVLTDATGHYTLPQVRLGSRLGLAAGKLYYVPNTLYGHRVADGCSQLLQVDASHQTIHTITLGGDGVTQPALTLGTVLRPTRSADGTYVSAAPTASAGTRSVTYQWLVDGKVVSTAYGDYRPTEAQIGHVLAARITASGRWYVPDSATGRSVRIEYAGVHVRGVPRVGQRLVLAEDSGRGHPEPYSITQWLRAGRPIPGATHRSYVLTAADLHHSVSVVSRSSDRSTFPDRLGAGVVVGKSRVRVFGSLGHPVVEQGQSVRLAVLLRVTDRLVHHGTIQVLDGRHVIEVAPLTGTFVVITLPGFHRTGRHVLTIRYSGDQVTDGARRQMELSVR